MTHFRPDPSLDALIRRLNDAARSSVEPDSTADQLRFKVRPGTGPFTETLTFTFENVRGDF